MRKRILFIIPGAVILLILHNYIEDRIFELVDAVRASEIELLSIRPSPVIKYYYHEGNRHPANNFQETIWH